MRKGTLFYTIIEHYTFINLEFEEELRLKEGWQESRTNEYKERLQEVRERISTVLNYECTWSDKYYALITHHSVAGFLDNDEEWFAGKNIKLKRFSHLTARKVAVLFERIDRPEYQDRPLGLSDLESKYHVIEDILSCFSETAEGGLVVFNEKEIEEHGNRFATISNAESCYTWYNTVGKHLLKSKTDVHTIEEMYKVIDKEYADVVAGIGHRWEQRIEFGIERTRMVREERKKLIERIIGLQNHKDFRPYYNLVQQIVEFIDLSTACVIWEYLCHAGYVEEYKQDITEYRSQKEYERIIRGLIFESNDEKRVSIRIILEHMSIDNIREFWNATKIRYGIPDDRV